MGLQKYSETKRCVGTIEMRAMSRPFILCFFFSTLSTLLSAQDTSSVDFYAKAGDFDFSRLITADSILTFDGEEGSEKIRKPEALGFIGSNYQRFHIHFISVIQDRSNPLHYFVYGKTMVKENICDFQGTLKVKSARIYNKSDLDKHQQGFVKFELLVFEDQKQPSSGSISGVLSSSFLIDSSGLLRYDATSFQADGFCNNQFIGMWSSYKSNAGKACHWGDFRIPMDGDLDIGAGEFSVNERYDKNGWLNYRLAYNSYSESQEVQQARVKELQPWWK